MCVVCLCSVSEVDQIWNLDWTQSDRAGREAVRGPSTGALQEHGNADSENIGKRKLDQKEAEELRPTAERSVDTRESHVVEPVCEQKADH